MAGERKETTITNVALKIKNLIALCEIRVRDKGRYFDRSSVSPEMFVWLHLLI